MENNYNLPDDDDMEYLTDDNIQSGTPQPYLEDMIILLDTEDLETLTIDKKKFIEGISSVSALCGAITALVNVGITPSDAMEYLVTKEMTETSLEYNKQVALIQKDASVESSKMNYINAVDRC